MVIFTFLYIVNFCIGAMQKCNNNLYGIVQFLYDTKKMASRYFG